MRKDTVSVKLPRKQYRAMKDLSDFTRVQLSEYMKEAADLFIETLLPIYRQRRAAEIKDVKSFSK
jgi:aminoglycoside phosphotransferase family enzyme